ncbi:hypothetical protein [Bradyrhizobium sp. HKCCYLR20261]|uniref:hypothetical protein n=1 Tax=Bradyrhizobium sp. HKCCYLR20261 TaxID=3420760 RepID=UPI003EB962F5
MSPFPDLLVLGWLAGIIGIAHKARSQLRVALRHPAPDASSADFRRFGLTKPAIYIDPAKLSEAGRSLLSRAQWGERFLFVWIVDVPLLVLIPLVSPPLHP